MALVQTSLMQLWAISFALLVGWTTATGDYLLPGDIKPEFYDLRLLTNLADLNENYTFSGDVAIKLNILNATDKIVLHSLDLTIDEEHVRVFKSDSTDACKGEASSLGDVKVTNQTYNKDNDFYTIHAAEKLEAGTTYIVCINFNGVLTQGLDGYYRSSYKELATGKTKWLAVTQFESTDARRAFPCFDEPAMKAKFKVTIGHTNTKSSISNMPLKSTVPIGDMDGWVWDEFDITVPMSTYLLAFMVSEMKYEDSPQAASNNVAFRVWARKDALPQVKFAAEIGPKILEDYENYFNIKFPLPKQDMVAVPDFSAGAMENWGLITYRETALLLDPNFTSFTSKPWVVSVIAHELAHQWFGNLVTMKWWTDLWLNEGFATYVETQETDKLNPGWGHLENSVANSHLSVLSLDALNSSHPISVPVGHPREIAQIFDTISYKKGSYIIRMMNLFLGENPFRLGVSNYLRKHAYGNAEQDDLWESLTEEAHKNNVLPNNMTVKQIMDTWTLQTGYPVLTVTRDYEAGTADVSQTRYFAQMSTLREKDKTQWWVPLTYTTSSKLDFNTTTPKTWLPKEKESITISEIPKDDWLLFNVQLSGLYRINYDPENWRRLSAILNSDSFNKIPVLNRVQIIDDSLHLARSGDLEYTVPLQILKYLSRETEYLPWHAAMRGLGHINQALYKYPIYGAYKGYIKSIINPIYNQTSGEKLEETPENLRKIKLQNLIAGHACKLNVGDCRSRAIHLYRQWMSSPNPDEDNPVPKDWRQYVYCYAIREGGEDEWNFAWKRYLNSNVGAHKGDLLSAMTCTREVWLINRYLRWLIDPKSGIRRQDARGVFAGIAANDIGYFLAKSSFFENIEEYYKYYITRTDSLSTYITSFANRITTQAEYDEVGIFDLSEVETLTNLFWELMEAKLAGFAKKNENYLKGTEQKLQQALEEAKINIQWQERFYQKMSRLLVDPSENTISDS